MNQTNWKTTVSAAVAAFFGFVLFSPEHFAQYPILIALSKYAMLGGLLSLGIHARDIRNG